MAKGVIAIPHRNHGGKKSKNFYVPQYVGHATYLYNLNVYENEFRRFVD